MAASSTCSAKSTPFKIPKYHPRTSEREANRVCYTSYEELSFHLEGLDVSDDDSESGNMETWKDRENRVRSILKKDHGVDDYVGSKIINVPYFFTPPKDCSNLRLGRSQSVKSVSFADDNDQSLVEIRTFATTPIMDLLSPDFNSFLSIRKDTPKRSLSVGMKPHWKPDISLQFKEPCTEMDFHEKLSNRLVSLEKCGTRNRLITGLVLVKNIEYKKSVLIRYTLDNWKTSSDAEAIYLCSIESDGLDRFTFTLNLPLRSSVMEFAICYKTSNAEFWDNNDNKNYRVEDVLQSPA